MEGVKDITLLTKEQIFGAKKLKIFKKRDVNAAITDFSLILGGYVSSINFDDTALEKRKGVYWTKSLHHRYNEVCVVRSDGNKCSDNIEFSLNGIRPALSFSKYSFFNKKKQRDRILEIEYGFYPQTAVSKDMQQELENNYQIKNVIETGKSYIILSRRYNNGELVFEENEHKEYEYNGKRYVRAMNHSVFMEVQLSNGQTYNHDDIVWVEVEPINWLVDKKAKLMISEKIICAGIPFSTASTYTGDFENTDIYKFLTTYFIKDIIQDKKSVKKEENKEKSEIEILLDEIEKYSDYSDNKNKLFDYVEQLISEYNKNVENLLNNDSQLKLETVNGLKTKLIVKLENIIDNLKVSYDKRYIYEEITKLLENYNKILIGEEIDTNDELISEFKKIYKSLTFIGNPKLVLEFIDLVDFEINKIKKYLENSYDEKKKIEYVDKKTFELYFRGKLHPLLVKLHSGAINKNVVNEISKMTQNELYETIEKQEKSIIDFYLKKINEEINVIKKLDFNNEYISIVENLLNNELNNLGDIKTTIKTLTDILCKLYEIEIQIKEKQIAKENIKKYRITRKFNRLTVI